MPKWTAEQQRAIETDGKNLLVSAAAGSGKTAVLVERIIEKLTRRENPVDVTELLVVTFTRAAAAEMRARIRKALEKAIRELDEKAGDLSLKDRQALRRHLKKQTLLLEQADISTMDAFFASMIRNYYQEIDLDPATRLADRDEMDLVELTVLSEFLEEEYASETSKIGFLADYFGGGSTEDELVEMILALYHFSRNHVTPDEALASYLAPYEVETAKELVKMPWYEAHYENVRASVGRTLDEISGLASWLETTDCPEGPKKTIALDREFIENALKATSATELKRRLSEPFSRFASAPRKYEGDPLPIERAKNVRKAYKDDTKEYADRLPSSEDDVLKELQMVRPAAEALIDMTRRFADRLHAEKKKRRIMDFNDQQHYVLEILVRDGQPTEAAEALRRQYSEILIDEYQDSNDLQEAILTSFARRDPETGEPMNIFMVGDIKQSIYLFRQARPALFNEKHHRYQTLSEAPKPEKIELAANFRSRKGVTDGVNFFFRKLMREEVGGVEYSPEVELNPRGAFPETDLPVGNDTTILLATPEDEENHLTRTEAEGHAIAREILKLTDPETGIYVKESDTTVRRAEFRDVVILLRATGPAETFREILESYGIPSYLKRKSGFFSTFEVQFALNYLSVVDNALDDVALTAVLRSPVIGFSSEELATINAKTKKRGQAGNLYPKLLAYMAAEDDDLAKRLRAFFREIERLRVISIEHGLTEVLRTVYRETGLLLFVNALPGGKERSANLRELLTKAADFEKTSMRGIFNFNRYIERIGDRDDVGEVAAIGENDNLVRIMTIHSSKGLEFPIVFVSNTQHLFNTRSQYAKVLMHDRFGIGLQAVNPEKRTRRKTTFYREVMKNAMDTEAKGEELRLLYVAMTRAKEKLYLTGGIRKEGDLDEYNPEFLYGPERLSPNRILGANCFLKWILQSYRESAPIRFDPVLTVGVIQEGVVENAVRKWLDREALTSLLSERVKPETEAEIRELLGGNYLYDDLWQIYSSLSVSELKHRAMEEQDPETPYRPPVRDDSGFGGAELGTLYHRILEKLDFEKPVDEGLDALEKEGLISAEEKGKINRVSLVKFLDSTLAARCRRAAKCGRAFREKQFIIGLPAEEIYPGAKIGSEGELVMIQGVIDLYFEEDDGLVLVDYKTDRVGAVEQLREIYKVQLDLYARALELISGKTVKEKWIYSLTLSEGILL